ncbi:MAG: [FeFe] hydrogenase H-cluster maturation GTPase HydF [Desulfovibrio sp.]|jgi:[FeFe] hydrogenase H-cluster maturation GTPase HydF|nr:[FeFe] hydrogenase H-cluster maturation GTPase HydF [Desulfovibrio sp.]
MGLNDTPSANRVHIGFFGRRNAGKSSMVNAVTGQELAVVSDVKGTTTDPVYKAMELLPLGPVLIIDTPGIDDEGPLGKLRVRRAKQVLNKIDVAVLVLDATESAGADFFAGGSSTAFCAAEKELIDIFREKEVPYIIAVNKIDLLGNVSVVSSGIPASFFDKASSSFPLSSALSGESIRVSAKTGGNIHLLKERIAALVAAEDPKLRLVADLIHPSDFVVLVTPIDKAAPKGRLILPQQQSIRDILEADAAAIVVKEYELRETLEHLGKKPSLVITDSQVFAKVAADVPSDVRLTSFSILFARYKGALETSVRGVRMLDRLATGDRVLIAEGCTHHRQCDDIGTVKLPRWIKNYTANEPEFRFCSGGEFPEDLSVYAMIIHCGGCMLNEREMRYRRRCAEDQHVPFTNYGITIAYIQGILRRSLTVFPHLLSEIEK